MIDLRERLTQGPVLIADGATGSLLQSRGHSGCLEALNLTAPDEVRQQHEDYVEAGAELVWTNSFGGSPLRLALADLDDLTEEVNEKAARIARDAAGDAALVLGSVGPCGFPLAPYGDLDPEDFRRDAARQIRGLVNGGADAIVIETMMDVEEALLALGVAREVAPELPVLVTLTFQDTKRGLFTPFGASPAVAAVRLAKAGADAVGANCGTGSRPMLSALREMKQTTDLPLVAKPNAGMPEASDEGPVWPEGPEFFALAMRDFLALGAAVIGGCCGTAPAHIQALKALLRG